MKTLLALTVALTLAMPLLAGCGDDAETHTTAADETTTTATTSGADTAEQPGTVPAGDETGETPTPAPTGTAPPPTP